MHYRGRKAFLGLQRNAGMGTFNANFSKSKDEKGMKMAKFYPKFTSKREVIEVSVIYSLAATQTCVTDVSHRRGKGRD